MTFIADSFHLTNDAPASPADLYRAVEAAREHYFGLPMDSTTEEEEAADRAYTEAEERLIAVRSVESVVYRLRLVAYLACRELLHGTPVEEAWKKLDWESRVLVQILTDLERAAGLPVTYNLPGD